MKLAREETHKNFYTITKENGFVLVTLNPSLKMLKPHQIDVLHHL